MTKKNCSLSQSPEKSWLLLLLLLMVDDDGKMMMVFVVRTLYCNLLECRIMNATVFCFERNCAVERSNCAVFLVVRTASLWSVVKPQIVDDDGRQFVIDGRRLIGCDTPEVRLWGGADERSSYHTISATNHNDWRNLENLNSNLRFSR